MPDTELIQNVPRSGGQVTVRQDLIADEYTVGRELAPAAASAAARAAIEMHIAAAKKFPRNEDHCRQRIMADCQRSKFAEIALYSKPVGKKRNEKTGKYEQQFAVDFSIKFIEAAIQRWGNAHQETRVDFETPTQIKIRVISTDLENVVIQEREELIEKLVERREQRPNQPLRGVRRNTYGDEVYLYDATKDEVRTLFGAINSKLLRDTGKKLLPRDLLDECRGVIEATLANEHAQDPTEQKKRIADKFLTQGVNAAMLTEYLGHSLDSLSPQEVAHLRMVYAGLAEGESTWAEVLRGKSEPAEAESAPAPAKRQSLKDRVMQQPAFTEKPKEEPQS